MKTSKGHRRSIRIKKQGLLALAVLGISSTIYFVNARSISLPDYSPDATSLSKKEAPIKTDTPKEISKHSLSDHQKAANHMAAGTPVMEVPRFFGVDDKQRPYHVTADKASWPDKEHAELEVVRAEAAFEQGFADIKANYGRYAVTDRILTLQGNVTIYAKRTQKDIMDHSKKSFAEIRTAHMTADLDNKKIFTDARVTVISDTGTLEADTFDYQAETGKAVFTGGVVLTLDATAISDKKNIVLP